MKSFIKISAFAFGVSLSAPAFAQDVPLTVGEKCFPVENIMKFYKKMSNLKADRMDTLQAVMNAQLLRSDETAPFNKLWTRSGDGDGTLTVDEFGNITDFHANVSILPIDAEICGETRSVEGEEAVIGLSLGSDIVFKNSTGPYTLAELQDGVSDGKTHYKKMFGNPMALLVPKSTHVLIEYVDESAPLTVSFTQGGQKISSPPVEVFGGAFFMSLEDIESSGADTMAVEGGPFILSPTPSVKKLKSLGFKDGDEDD